MFKKSYKKTVPIPFIVIIIILIAFLLLNNMIQSRILASKFVKITSEDDIPDLILESIKKSDSRGFLRRGVWCFSIIPSLIQK